MEGIKKDRNKDYLNIRKLFYMQIPEYLCLQISEYLHPL